MSEARVAAGQPVSHLLQGGVERGKGLPSRVAIGKGDTAPSIMASTVIVDEEDTKIPYQYYSIIICLAIDGSVNDNDR